MEGILGRSVSLDLGADSEGRPFRIDEEQFVGHLILAGQSGTGKSQTVLRMATEISQHWKWRVIWIDAKADQSLMSELASFAGASGVRLLSLPTHGYSIWFGNDQVALTERLVELTSCVGRDRVLAEDFLLRGLRNRAGDAHELSGLIAHLPNSLSNHPVEQQAFGDLSATARLLEATYGFQPLDGPRPPDLTTFGNADLIYLPIDALNNHATAERLAAVLLRTLAYQLSHDPSARRTLLIFDEFSAIPVAIATDLVERIRSAGVQCVLTVQAFAGLGEHAERLVGATNWIMLHRTADASGFIGANHHFTASGLGLGEAIVFHEGKLGRFKIHRYQPRQAPPNQ